MMIKYITRKSSNLLNNSGHVHTQYYIYIVHMYVCVCMCVCVCEKYSLFMNVSAMQFVPI